MTDTVALVRSLGALLTVLGCLAGALWAVRRFNLVLPGTGPAADRRLAVVERLSLDPRRSLALLRRDDVEHLVLIAPEGHLVIESRIAGAAAVRPAAQPLARIATTDAKAPLLGRLGIDFGLLIERARQPLGRGLPVASPGRRGAAAANRRNRNA